MTATKALLILNVLVFAAELLTAGSIIDRYALWPVGSKNFHLYQFFTYAFLHAGWLHIFFNMLGLWMFGAPVEEHIGSARFLALYLTAALTGAAVQLTVFGFSGVVQPIVGASAGVVGLLLAFSVYFPREKIIFLLLPIPMSAWIFIILYLLGELFFAISGMDTGIGHWAHLGGALGAGALLLLWQLVL